MSADSALTHRLTPTTERIRLSERWLWLARIVWVLMAAVNIIPMLVMLPGIFESMRTLDLFAARMEWSVSEVSASLNAAGVTPQFAITMNQVIAILILAGFWLSGILLFWLRSDDWMSLLTSYMFIGMGAGFAGVFPDLLAGAAGREGLSLILYRLWGALATIVWPTLLTYFYLFPSGRFVPRFGWVAAVITYGLHLVGETIAYGLAPPLWLEILTLTIITGGVASQIYRYRRVSTSLERQQTKLVIFGLTTFLVTWVVDIGLSLLFPPINEPGASGVWYGVIGNRLLFLTGIIPIAMLISMLRYRLWDVDFIINRTLIYGLLIVVLGGVFIAAFFGLRALWEALLGEGQEVVAAVLPAVFITLIANPTYKRLRRFVDQRLYGIKVDYVQAAKADEGNRRDLPRIGSTQTDFSPYTDLSLLGRGGMGEVYRAHHPTLNRSVAIKIMPPHAEENEESHKRFNREAQTIARLKHPNIVTLHDVGERNGQPFMVMEFIDGPDLSTVLKQRGRLPMDEARPVIQDIAAALDYAHSQGVIHRDVKPSNVMVEHVDGTQPGTAGGQARTSRTVLMDFGIAKSYAAATRLTQSGMIGTLDYISPEQIQGSSDVDGRADIYSLGVMVYQMLTGGLPFKHHNPGAIVLAHLMQPPPDPRLAAPDLSEEAADAILRALAKQPEARFATAGDFAAALISD